MLHLRRFPRRLLLLAALAALGSGAFAPDAARAGDAPAAEPGFAGFHVEPLVILSEAQRTALHARADHGNVVALVVENGPADRAGLRLGDLVLQWDGKDVPDVTNPDRYQPGHHEWRLAMRTLMDGLVAGRPFSLVVLRGGEKKTLEITPVSEAEFHRRMGGVETPIPLPDRAGSPVRLSLPFDGGTACCPLPAIFRPYEGRWSLVPEAGGCPANGVLRQDAPVLPWAVLLVTGPGHAYGDVRVRVRFQPISGVVDGSGGIIFRARDAKNYYVVRANALEDNLNLYIVKDGVRTALKEERVTPPAFHAWHTLEVTAKGDSFRAVLDGRDVVQAKDGTFSSGWVGLWTKADSVTLFDDLESEPVAAK
jgi:hypothetical protein